MGDAMNDTEVEVSEDAASKTYPMQCSALRKNGNVILKGRPCKIVDMSTSKTGKHGHAKVHMVGIDLFSGKKYEDICPSTHNMSVPVVTRTKYTLLDISDGFLSLINEKGEVREDIKTPADASLLEDMKKKLDDDNCGQPTVVILKAMEEEMPVSVESNTN